MKQLIFRAWRFDKKKMINPVGLFWNDITHAFFSFDKFATGYKEKGETRIAINIKHENDERNYRDFVLMQYIGIRDKEKIEIFEGDIVDIKPDKNRKDYPNLNLDSNGIIRIEVGDMRFLPEILFEEPDRLVIGNVFKNPKFRTGTLNLNYKWIK